MDCQDYITESVERKKGQHLQREERGVPIPPLDGGRFVVEIFQKGTRKTVSQKAMTICRWPVWRSSSASSSSC